MALSLTDPGAALDGRWHVGIGDPTLIGWVTVAGYFLGASVAFLAYRSCRSEGQRFDPARAREGGNQRLLASFWLLACITLTALGINKQLDMQTLLTQAMRDVAHMQG